MKRHSHYRFHVCYGCATLAILLSGCRLIPEGAAGIAAIEGPKAPKTVSWSDPRVTPLLTAMSKVDRASKGFLPLVKTSPLTLTSPSYKSDCRLSVRSKVTHDIFFRKTPKGYKWILEQEGFKGPRRFKDASGHLSYESIHIEYQTEPINGPTVNHTFVLYMGNDPRFAKGHPYIIRQDLTLHEIAPILKQWHYELPEKALQVKDPKKH